MAIDLHQGGLVVLCDYCPSGIHTDTGNPQAAWLIARRAGWRRDNVDAAWKHSCPACEAAKQNNTAA
jgi:hypothetical protein